MLLPFALLVIGETVLFTGPVQAVIVKFDLTGENTTTRDSLLCPNRTYTFRCEVNNAVLRLRSFDSNGVAVDNFDAEPGFSSSQNDFDFAAMSSVNGLIATAVADSSTGLMSAELECRDTVDNDFTSLITKVKHPLDAISNLTSVCYIDHNITQLIWDPVDCATKYSLYVFGMGWFNTTETSYNVSATTFFGEIFVFGGSGSVKFFTSCTSASTTVIILVTPGAALVEDDDCLIAIPSFEISGNTNIKTGYTIMFIDLPVDGSAYYETVDGHVEDISIVDGVGEIDIDSTNVTVYVTHDNGTVYCSRQLQEPTVSGEGIIIVFWILVVIVLLVMVLGVGGTITVTVIVKQKGFIQGKSHDNIDLDPDVSEMKTRGSNM